MTSAGFSRVRNEWTTQIGVNGMSSGSRTLYCAACGRKTTHFSTFSRTAMMISIFTLGLFLLIWPFLHLFGSNWICRRCGRARCLLKKPGLPY